MTATRQKDRARFSIGRDLFFVILTQYDDQHGDRDRNCDPDGISNPAYFFPFGFIHRAVTARTERAAAMRTFRHVIERLLTAMRTNHNVFLQPLLLFPLARVFLLPFLFFRLFHNSILTERRKKCKRYILSWIVREMTSSCCSLVSLIKFTA